MGSDNLFKKKKGLDNYKRNPKPLKNVLDTILIVCEGEKTEPNYFKSFPINEGNLKVTILGTGTNTLSLVEKTIKIIENSDITYNQVWCVFDKDSFPDDNFDNTIKKAKEHNFFIAYSNEAFELWYILHFDYIQNGMSRKDYKHKLTEKLKEEYLKNDKNIYNKIIKFQQTAIKNAKKLESLIDKSLPYSKRNPSTTVYQLVEELNKWI